MAKQELGPNQSKWIEALESGEFRQGKQRLEDAAGRNCCLGVLCRVLSVPVFEKDPDGSLRFGVAFDEYAGVLPRMAIGQSGLRGCDGVLKEGYSIRGVDNLVRANDKGATFSEIAAFCRAHPEAVFTCPR